jgi:phosphohistidine phosphatase
MGSKSGATVPQQAAVIAFRRTPDGADVCLIRRRDSIKWAIPKGFIDPGQTAREAALVEAFEEAGLEGRIVGPSVGTYEYEKWDARLTVAVYLMEVRTEHRRWKEMRLRERKWQSLEGAKARLARHPVRACWKRIRKRLSA